MKSTWEKPELQTLDVSRTLGGFIQNPFEGPFNVVLGGPNQLVPGRGNPIDPGGPGTS